jgi:hypothetical protein
MEGTFVAQRVQVLLICDMHDDDTPGTQSLTFSVDGIASRKAGRAVLGGRGRPARHVNPGVDPAAVRAWAKSKGIKVNERGRIGADLLEQYAAAGF